MAKSRKPGGGPARRSPEDEPRPAENDDEVHSAEDPGEESLLDIDLSSADFVDTPIANADRIVRDVTDSQAAIRPRSRLPKLPSKQLVLIGAGQAHLQIVDWWQKHHIRGVELTLVTAFEQAASSNMLSGALAGLYQSDQMLIDVPELCRRRGVRLIVDRANLIDPIAKLIEFAHQPALNFDLVSINIGSVPTEEPMWQSHRIMISTKPMSTFLARFNARFHELVEQWKQAPGSEMLQVVVVGSGLDSVELAFSLEQRRYDLELPIDVRIVDGHTEILNGRSRSLVQKVKKLFRKRGIELNLGSPVVDCDDLGPPSLVLENGQRIRADLVIWVAEAAPPMAVRGFQLPKSDQGFLKVRPTLQSVADVPVFIVGDVASLDDDTTPKSGAHAPQQAVVLQENLERWFEGEPLAIYQPNRSTLSFLSCADGTAILSYKQICLRSKWVWWLKDRIDRQWMQRFQQE